MFGGLGSRQQGITNFAQYKQWCNRYKELLRSSRALTKELEEQETALLRQKPSRDILRQLQDVMRMKLRLVGEIKSYQQGIDLLQESIMRREPWQQMRAWDKGLPPIRDSSKISGA
ncbi:hypothetical protein Y1Q_0023963 [Alligator mississippiensis]|uniref:Uncharacterized protein n=1 Tax=Alligator mississippiensis TaxID=8496 RepID=A0A151MLV1_ALLMI|nr:hypothetical protein Y1Q_0023963 [Alligator mississippiensis]